MFLIWNYTHIKDKCCFLAIKPTRCTNFSNLFLEWNSSCFRQFLCPSSRDSRCTHSNGICHTGLSTACKQDQDVPSWSCCQAVSKPAVCTVKNSWWWTEELSKTCRVSIQNKFEKLVHLVGFIVRIYHDAWSHERQMLFSLVLWID